MIPYGIFTTQEAENSGVSRMQLASLVKAGRLERLARGVYSRPEFGDDPMVEAAILTKRCRDCVIALESALRVHNFTTAVPHSMWVALPRGVRRPSMDFPIEVVLIERGAYSDGIVERCIAGVQVRVYSPAKTVADLFKFRSRTGLDLAIEAMKEGIRLNLFTIDELMRHALIDRVGNVILPYLEGYLG